MGVEVETISPGDGKFTTPLVCALVHGGGGGEVGAWEFPGMPFKSY